MKQITPEEAKKYNKLGEAFGVDLNHCINEGKLHCKDFEKRAKYYVIVSMIKSETGEHKFITNQSSMVVVKFYE